MYTHAVVTSAKDTVLYSSMIGEQRNFFGIWRIGCRNRGVSQQAMHPDEYVH